jgi:dolichol-phosphate mannosyltransferase
MNEKINIVIPTYNEDKNILSLLKKIKLYVPNAKVCIVDDSKENKIKHILKKNKLHSVLYFHRKNSKGRGSAIIFGFKKLLKKKQKQIFIEMDADSSHNPSELKNNIQLFKNEKCDLLISSRYMSRSRILNWPLSRRLFSKMSNILAEIVLRLKISDYTNGFRIYSKDATKIIIKKCGKIGDGFIILSEILVAVNINRLKINETHSIFVNRIRGESSVNLRLILQSFFGLLKLFLIKKKYLIKNNSI